MSYKLRADEPLVHALGRISREQLDHAIDELTIGIKQDPAVAVHTARKAIKKQRSALRLYRAALPARQRREANEELRTAARSLSEARDADVMITTIEQLSERFAGQLPATTFEVLRSEFAGRTDGGRSASPGKAVEGLRSVRGRVESWPAAREGWKAIAPGLTRSYRRGRKAFARAEASRSQEDLHAWRKRVKDVWYHERLLAPVAGRAVGGHAKDAHRLADLLGDDHDLALLDEQLTDIAPAVAIDLSAVRALIEHRRDELQTEAIYLGRRLYAESPKAFRRRLRRSIRAGQAGAGAPQQQDPAELAAAIRAARRHTSLPGIGR
jgi:CHAD domain-containing protein